MIMGLKKPFIRVLAIHEKGDKVWVLIMGQYHPDALVSIHDAIIKNAKKFKHKLVENYILSIIYIGPDEIPDRWIALLPDNGKVACVYHVSRFKSGFLTPACQIFLSALEDAMELLISGRDKKRVAEICWENLMMDSVSTPVCMFVRCFDEFRHDVYRLNDSLREQKMIPRKKRQYKPFDPYEEFGVDPNDFGV